MIEADDALVEELALLENIHRQDLNIIEEGKAYQRLLKRGWTLEDLAKLGYKKTGPIYNRLSLLISIHYSLFTFKKALLRFFQAFSLKRAIPDYPCILSEAKSA